VTELGEKALDGYTEFRASLECGDFIHHNSRKESFPMSMKRKPPTDNVRRVISLGNNFRGVTTNKRDRLVQFESEQERKLILLLERDPSVVDYVSQPETLIFSDGKGRQRRYTPDFQVWRVNGKIELHEVTVQSRRESHESLHEREAAAQLICQERGWQYVVHTDQTLPSDWEYASLDFLSAFRTQCYADIESANWWLEKLKGRGQIHPKLVLSQLEPGMKVNVLITSLYYMLWHGEIEMNWRQPFFWQGDFHLGASIWLPEGGER